MNAYIYIQTVISQEHPWSRRNTIEPSFYPKFQVVSKTKSLEFGFAGTKKPLTYWCKWCRSTIFKISCRTNELFVLCFFYICIKKSWPFTLVQQSHDTHMKESCHTRRRQDSHTMTCNRVVQMNYLFYALCGVLS